MAIGESVSRVPSARTLVTRPRCEPYFSPSGFPQRRQRHGQMNAVLQGFIQLIPRIQRRFPSVVQRRNGWANIQDGVHHAAALFGASGRRLWEAHAGCRTASDWYDFATLVFPAHQVKVEILGFLELINALKPSLVMEIGSGSSGTQFLLGQALPSVDTIFALDLKVWHQKLLKHFSRPELRRICIEGSSYSPSTVERVRKLLDGRSIDVLFIDGDHRYEGVRADFEAYSPFVRPGGLIALHDIVEDHRTRFGRSSGGWVGGVPRFWREISLGKRTWTFVADPDQDGMGIGVIEKDGETVIP